ncbi:allantoinase [Lactarius quietus]|nr:allantoinase [Lactarius quietus]
MAKGTLTRTCQRTLHDDRHSGQRPCLGFHRNNVLLPGSQVPQPATTIVSAKTGKIIEITDDHWLEIDDDKYLLPGLVDMHVHLNEPWCTEGLSHKLGGFCTGTRAAASSRVTAVVDMLLNSIPPMTSVDNLEVKRHAMCSQCWTDAAFWSGVIPSNQGELVKLVDAGMKVFKCFMIESGIKEFPYVSESDLRPAMDALKDTESVLMFHAEVDDHPVSPNHEDPTQYRTFSHLESYEVDAVSRMVNLQKEYPTLRCHIVHLSAAIALPIICRVKAADYLLTVETCFHYLCLNSDTVPNGRPKFKCCPPIRDDANCEALWAALLDGTINCVVSNHSPCVAELKRLDDGDIMGAWGCISMLGLRLSLLWTEAWKQNVPIRTILQWTSLKTASHMDRVGYDANLVIWDPDAEYIVTKESLQFKNELMPYKGMVLSGRVERTIL